MKPLALSIAIGILIVASAHSQPVSAPATAPPIVGTPGAAPDPCSREVVIYVDLSGTMTKPAPDQQDRNLVPLNFISATLQKFVANPEFVRPGDAVTVKFFGTYVKTKAEGFEESIAILEQLADRASWQAAIQADQGTFLKFTDFGRAFGDVKLRVEHSRAAQQIVFVASDFAEDRLDKPNKDNVAERTASFDAALATIQPLVGDSAAGGGGTRVFGLSAPEPSLQYDRAVAAHATNRLRQEGVRIYDFNEDANEAATTLWNAFITPIRAEPAEGAAVRIGADGAVAFRLFNDNCSQATIEGIDLRNSGKSHQERFAEPLRLGNGQQDVRIGVDKLAALWNSEVEISPILPAATTARTTPSPRFWLGDWVRLTRPGSFTYPRGQALDGNTLLSASIDRSLRAAGKLTIRGLESGGRGREFDISPGQGEALATFAFNLDPSQISAFRTGAQAVLEGNGLRLLEPGGPPRPSVTLPVPPAVSSSLGTYLLGLQGVSLIAILYLFIAIAIRPRSADLDAKKRNALAGLLRRYVPVLFAAGSNGLLLLRYGSIPLVDDYVVSMVVTRATLAFIMLYVIGTQLIFQGGLWSLFERKFLPNNDAVFMRTAAFACVIAGSLLLSGAAVYYLVWSRPVASPSAVSRLLEGALR